MQVFHQLVSRKAPCDLVLFLYKVEKDYGREVNSVRVTILIMTKFH